MGNGGLEQLAELKLNRERTGELRHIDYVYLVTHNVTFRASHFVRCKAQFAGNGESFSRIATRQRTTWVAPFGRAAKGHQ